MMWKREPAIEGVHGGCLNCGPRPSFLSPESVIAVGFGYAALHRDGGVVWQEHSDYDERDLLTCAQAEAIASEDEDHDWRIVLDGPLSGRTYQRHGPGSWVLIDQNKGFA